MDSTIGEVSDQRETAKKTEHHAMMMMMMLAVQCETIHVPSTGATDRCLSYNVVHDSPLATLIGTDCDNSSRSCSSSSDCAEGEDGTMIVCASLPPLVYGERTSTH